MSGCALHPFKLRLDALARIFTPLTYKIESYWRPEFVLSRCCGKRYPSDCYHRAQHGSSDKQNGAIRCRATPENLRELGELAQPFPKTRALPVELLRDTFTQLGLKDQTLFALASLHARNPTTAWVDDFLLINREKLSATRRSPFTVCYSSVQSSLEIASTVRTPLRTPRRATNWPL